MSPNLGDIREEVATLRAEVHSLTKRNILAFFQIIPLTVQPAPLYGPRFFDLFLVDEETISIIWIREVEW